MLIGLATFVRKLSVFHGTIVLLVKLEGIWPAQARLEASEMNAWPLLLLSLFMLFLFFQAPNNNTYEVLLSLGSGYALQTLKVRNFQVWNPEKFKSFFGART